MATKASNFDETVEPARRPTSVQASELSYRRLFETAQDGILILDFETGRIEDVNPFLCQLLGFSHEEIVGKTVGEVSPLKDVLSNQAVLAELQKEGYIRYENLPLETRDGRHIAVEFVSNVYQAGAKTVIQCNIRDITERQRVELSLRRFAAIVESSDDAIVGKDLNSIITSWNKGAERIFGYTAEEMIGSSIMRLVPPSRQHDENHILAKIKGGESVRHFETLRQTKDGRIIHVSITVSPIKDATGKIVGISKVARDISERIESARQLTLLHSCVARLNEIVLITEAAPIEEPGPRMVFVNEAFERITGYASAEVLGRSPRFLQGEKTDPAVLAEIQDALLRQKPIRRQIINYRRDGTEFWMDIDVVPIFSRTGKCTHFVYIERDVTEERKNREQLVWKTTLLEAQLESSIDGILVVDIQGRRVLQNRRMNELWQVPEFLAGNNDDEAQLPFAARQTKNPAQFTARVAYFYQHPEESGHDEIELINGTVLDRYSAPVRDQAGIHHGRIWSFRDITKRRKLEAQFLQAQKMESIGQLAGGIAHDFNNILAALVGSTFLLKMEAGDNPVMLDYLKDMEVTTGRATDLVKQILTFSRHDKPDRGPLQLNDVVVEVLKLLRASLPSTIRIQTELTETGRIRANPTAIHQAIMNLGTNAWHAMRGRPGLLKVETGMGEADADFLKIHPDLRPGSYVRLSVSDTGCGMNAPMLEKVFEPFFTTKAAGEGTGLGLAVVHGIMRSHDGTVTVESAVGVGTTFHLYFPVMTGMETPPDLDFTAVPTGHGERILWVDDEEMLARNGKAMLERLGYRVTEVTSAREAIAAVADPANAFDLVITDLTMPAMDGVSLARQLLREQPGLAIILTTGHIGPLTLAEVRDAGFHDLLAKPVDARVLGEAVQRVLQQKGTAKRAPSGV